MSNPTKPGDEIHEVAEALELGVDQQHAKTGAPPARIAWIGGNRLNATAIISTAGGRDVRVLIADVGPTPPPAGSEIAI